MHYLLEKEIVHNILNKDDFERKLENTFVKNQ
jgi:hypothetical protein